MKDVELTMKMPIAALGTFALLPGALVADGCGSGDTTASGSGAATERQAAAVASPRPTRCGQPEAKDTPEGVSGDNGMWLWGAIYISCVDQPVTVSASGISRTDWRRGLPTYINGPNGEGNGTEIRPGAFLVSSFACKADKSSWGWTLGLRLADGSTATARVELPACGKTAAKRVRFNTVDGPTSTVVETETGQRLRLVAKRNTEIPGLERTDGTYSWYAPIFIEAA